MELSFTKLHGCLNDYLFFDCTETALEHASEVSRILSNRRSGVGSDGIICIYPSGQADLRMEMYNADGSRGQMCGNGIRALGKYAFEHGLVSERSLEIETDSGTKVLSLHGEGRAVDSVSVEMGQAVLDGRSIPVDGDGEIIDAPLTVDGRDWTVTCVAVGNPHCVTFDEDPADLDLEAIGPAFAGHSFFPAGVNTEFVRVNAPNHLTMRVWERGSGETAACGTGACAAVVAAVLSELAERSCRVELAGGSLDIEYREDGSVLMTGPAVELFTATVYVDLERGRMTGRAV